MGIEILVGQAYNNMVRHPTKSSCSRIVSSVQEELPSAGFPAVDESELLEDTLEASSSS